MPDVNIRVPEEIAATLRAQAERCGLSLSAFVQQVLTREAEFGPNYAQRPIAVPVGFSSVADELKNAADAKKRGTTGFWLVGYRSPNNVMLAVVGEILDIQPTYVQMELFAQDAPKMLIPRSALVWWQLLPDTNPHVVFRTVHEWQRFGFYLHPAINYSDREVNGIVRPPTL